MHHSLARRFGLQMPFYGWYIATPAAAILYCVVLGFPGGTQSVVGSAIWAHYYGREGLGAIQGPAAMVMIAASALAPLPLAALQSAFDEYQIGLLIFAAVPLLCAALLTAFRQTPTTS
ncbi:MAG TPA: hypothetical protein PKA05_23315 [Roseiflexaceae bacterium]|nr:hypothetical protein [Roseiflexaceae bacterium]HMP43323.1 hypothetical protein [Roseiflexaceae bacterium]